MIQAAKIIGTGLAITGLIGAGVGIGVVFWCINSRSS
jgi:F-type H+-transporting ATPase subunit c